MRLCTGGALSNIVDRLLRGHVIDYIGFQTRWEKLTRITFNLGDFAIAAGTVIVTLGRLPGGLHRSGSRSAKAK